MKWREAIQAGLLWVLGAVANIYFLEHYARGILKPGPVLTIATHPATRVAAGLLGGSCLLFFMTWLVRRTTASPAPRRWRAMLLGGAFAVGALWCSFTALFLLLSVGLALWGPWRGHGHSALTSFVFLCLEINTYGAEIILRNIPLQFALGVLCGVYAYHARPSHPVSQPKTSPVSPANRALLLAVSGFVLFFVPFVGITLSIAGLVYAVKALRGHASPVGRPLGRAITALLISIICIAYYSIGVAMLLASRPWSHR